MGAPQPLKAVEGNAQILQWKGSVQFPKPKDGDEERIVETNQKETFFRPDIYLVLLFVIILASSYLYFPVCYFQQSFHEGCDDLWTSLTLLGAIFQIFQSSTKMEYFYAQCFLSPSFFQVIKCCWHHSVVSASFISTDIKFQQSYHTKICYFWSLHSSLGKFSWNFILNPQFDNQFGKSDASTCCCCFGPDCSIYNSDNHQIFDKQDQLAFDLYSRNWIHAYCWTKLGELF